MEQSFGSADILLPAGCDMTKWSVIACDQFTARPSYWDALERETAGVPSTLHLILPEAYLDRLDPAAETARINAAMAGYLSAGVFREARASYVYVERTLPSGRVRRGLVGAFDLEAYAYGPEARTPIRATEDTVPERLPPRVEIRRNAPLEVPHVMVFCDDRSRRLFPTLASLTAGQTPVYDFDLCAGGGHIRGFLFSGSDARRTDAALARMEADAAARSGPSPLIYAVGDGNHSLAAAKRCWEELKPSLSPSERERHPARYSLAELVDIGDAGVSFAPIHRCLFGTDPSAFLREAKEVFAERYRPGERSYPIRLVTAAGELELYSPAAAFGALVAEAERFCGDVLARHGGSLDYIHNDAEARALGTRPGNAALLLPCPERTELFPAVEACGPLPKKSFSIGLAEEKRYYLECRRIQTP